MPKNFDELLIEDRVFVVSGEEFEWVTRHWSVLSELIDEGVAASQNGDKKKDDEAPTLLGTMEGEAKEVAKYLDPKDHERWFALVNDKERPNPVSFVQLNAISQWLVEQQTARPTDPGTTGKTSEASSTGRGRRAPSSAAASS
jgi:hypothetical protein